MSTIAALLSGIVSLISAAMSWLTARFNFNAGKTSAVEEQERRALDDIAKANDARQRQRELDARGVPDDKDPNRRD